MAVQDHVKLQTGVTAGVGGHSLSNDFTAQKFVLLAYIQ